MTPEFLFACGTAVWLGILCSLSPCPLATNIAAVGFVARKVGRIGLVLGAGLLYTLGRTLTYGVLGILLVGGLTAAPEVSHLLEKYMNLLTGPLLILVAMVLLGLLPVRLPSGGGKLGERLARTGIRGAFPLGIVFALSFCPTSAALFFGSLLPLALKMRSGVLLPVLFGVATGLPVLIFSFLLAFAANRIGRACHRLAGVEIWAQRITGGIFLAAGIYMTVFITLKASS